MKEYVRTPKKQIEAGAQGGGPKPEPGISSVGCESPHTPGLGAGEGRAARVIVVPAQPDARSSHRRRRAKEKTLKVSIKASTLTECRLAFGYVYPVGYDGMLDEGELTWCLDWVLKAAARALSSRPATHHIEVGPDTRLLPICRDCWPPVFEARGETLEERDLRVLLNEATEIINQES